MNLCLKSLITLIRTESVIVLVNGHGRAGKTRFISKNPALDRFMYTCATKQIEAVIDHNIIFKCPQYYYCLCLVFKIKSNQRA